MRLLELFLLCCLLRESPPLDAGEKAEISHNSLEVSCRGRTPGLMLKKGGNSIELREWATELAEDMCAVAGILDAGEATKPYLDSLNPLLDAIDDQDNTPSAKVLAEMRENRESFQAYALRKSRQHEENFRARPLDGETAAEFRLEAEASLAAQRRIEEVDALSFEQFLGAYFAEV